LTGIGIDQKPRSHAIGVDLEFVPDYSEIAVNRASGPYLVTTDAGFAISGELQLPTYHTFLAQRYRSLPQQFGNHRKV
jgi:3D (Asp-Asp-Asp) domain-containing protein